MFYLFTVIASKGAEHRSSGGRLVVIKSRGLNGRVKC